MLSEIFKKQQAEFLNLKRLDFPVTVALVDEKGLPVLQFIVEAALPKPPLPRDKPTPYPVPLPEQIVQLARREGIKPETLQTFIKGDDGCDNTDIQVTPGTSNGNWILTLACRQPPQNFHILGFGSIPAHPGDRPKDLPFHVPVQQEYWLDDQQRLITGELSLPLSKLETQLCFRTHSGSSPCLCRTITLLQLLKQDPLVLTCDDPAQSVNRATSGHTLILIALSEGLQMWGNTIQEVLYQKLLNLQSLEAIPRFELWTLQPGGKLSFSLSFEELSKLSKEGEANSIRGKIETGLIFSAPSLHALRDLETLDIAILGRTGPDKQVSNILYLTDNAGLRENPLQIPSKQVGIPLAWRQLGIELTVLTAAQDGCKAWQRAQAECQEWRGNANDLRAVLDRFLPERGGGK